MPAELSGEPVYGRRAALAVLARRPGDIQHVAFAPELRSSLEPLLRHCAARRIPAAPLDERALGRLCGTDQHEGVCLDTKPRRFEAMPALTERLARASGTAIALDRVRNPYNTGAILRSAAFFGVDAAVIGMAAPHPALPPLAVRVAEGGAEHLAIGRTTDLSESLARMRGRGLHVLGAESDAADDAFGVEPPRPWVLVLGHEREGLSPRVRAQCDRLVRVAGGGAIDSLNVSVAASVLLALLLCPKLVER